MQISKEINRIKDNLLKKKKLSNEHGKDAPLSHDIINIPKDALFAISLEKMLKSISLNFIFSFKNNYYHYFIYW